MSNVNKNPLDSVNDSGYLLQLKLECEVNKMNSKWEVISREHYWENQSLGVSGYIDFILAHGDVRLVIECKRRLATEWVFLVPKQREQEVDRVRFIRLVDFLNKWEFDSNGLKSEVL